MKAYSKETRLKLVKILKDHVKNIRRDIPWSGENDAAAKKIMKLFK